MRFSQRSSEDFIGRLDSRENFFEELRESFTKSFAYDLFEWPDVSAAAEVTFQPLPKVAGNKSANTAGDPEGTSDSEAVALYTTTASDIPLYMPGQAVPIEGDAALVPSTSASSPLIAMDEFRVDARFDGIDGSGYTVAVLDSGIDLDDPFFGPDSNGDGISDRIVYQYDFADGDANASDVDGHGSNVASIAASSDGTYTGMAPGADIAALKVFSDSGAGNFGYLESALQWVINNAEAYNIVSVNMSLGDSGNYNAPVQLYGIADELATLASMDVIVVSASGNSFYPFNSFQGVSYPAADPNSLSVGAVYDGNVGGYSYQSGAIAYSTTADQIAPFSQRDDQLSDIFAPGAPITGAGAGDALETMHGTSQAAPHIAGIVAVAQQLAVQELGRKLTFDEFSQLLADSGDTIFDGDDEDDNVNNTGLAFQRVNMLALGEAILALAPPEPDPRGATFFQISAIDKADPEGDGGATAFTFLITRSGDTSEADTVDYSVAGSGANPAAANDFLGGSFPSGSVTFGVGETSQIVTIQVAGDSTVEPDEGFAVTIDSVPANAQIVVPSDTATIQDDDGQQPGNPVVLVNADFNAGGATSEGFTYIANAFGGNTSANYARGTETNDIRVVLGGRDSADIVDMSGGWARSFTLDSEMEVTLSFLYEMILDSDYESDEFSQVLFSLNGGAAQVIATLTGDGNGGPDQTTGQQNFLADLGVLPAGTHTIILGGYNNKKTYSNEITEIRFDDVQVTGVPTAAPPAGNDTFFAITADEAAKAEGDSGSTLFSFTVIRSGDTGAADSVDYAVVGSGVSGSDFVGGALPSGTVAFAAGETSQTVTIAVAGDNEIEADEGFGVVLSNPSAGAEISTASAISIIQNDDLPSTAAYFDIAALDAVKAEGDTGSTAFTFEVTRAGPTSQTASVSYAVSYGTADGSDFSVGFAPGGELLFFPGEISKTITFAVRGDREVELDEDFTVTLYDASAGMEINVASAQGIIINDEVTPTTFIEIAPLDAVKPEGDSGATPFTFTVTRSGDISAGETVGFQTASASGGGFADGHDFVSETNSVTGTVDFLAGEASKTITINVQGDTFNETDERFLVELTSASESSAIITGSAEGRILNDDVHENALISITTIGGPLPESDSNIIPHGFQIARTGNLSNTVSFDYSVSGEVDGADFQGGVLPSGTVTLSPSQKFASINIDVQGDRDFEPDESFTVTLSNPSEGAEITTASAESVILNDDQEPGTTFYEISALNAVQAEGDSGDTHFTFTISRSGDLSFYSTIKYSLSGAGTDPADGADFIGGLFSSRVASFAATQSSVTVTIQVSGDSGFEPNEDFVVSIFDPTDQGIITTPSATGTILNDDDLPVTSFLRIQGAPAIEEGDTGTTTFTFSVIRQGDFHPAGSVDYYVSASTADAADFPGGVLPSGTIYFAEGETSQTFTVDVAGDTAFEADEIFSVTLTNPSPGLQTALDTARGTILNDDLPPQGESIVLLDADFTQGSGAMNGFNYFDGALGIVTDTRYVHGNYTGEDLRIWMGGVDDFAVNGASGGWDREFYVFDPMEVTLSFQYRMSHAGAFESDEFTQVLFTINDGPVQLVDELSGDSGSSNDAIIGPTTYQVSLGVLAAGYHKLVLGGYLNHKDSADEESEIFFDDVLVTGQIPQLPATFFAIADDDAVKAEGDAGSTAFTFTVTRSGDTTEAGTVDYAVSGSDVDGNDFSGGVLPSGSVSFAAGEISQTITVEVSGDVDFEGDETFSVTLSNPSSGSEITAATAEGTILNDDAAPPATFFAIADDDAVKAEGDAGATAFTFTVTRSGDTTEAGTVDYAVSGSDVDGNDFSGGVLPSGSVAFVAGEVTKTLTVNVSGDADFEGDEAFTVTLSNPSSGSEITTATAGGTILNDDTAPPATFFTIAADDAVKTEGDTGSTAFTFTVTRSGDLGQAGSVDYAVTGPAVDGADFAGGLLPSGAVAFLSGEASKTLTIDVAGDFAFEGNETFTVTLSNPSVGSAITTASAEGDILNDDEAIGPPGGPITLIDENFDGNGDTGGFSYEDGGFGGDNPQAYADGSWNAGALSVNLGGIDNSTARDMSGGWTKDFFLEAESEVNLSFLYELIHAEGYESDEFSQVLVSIDGGTPVVVNSLTGDGNGGGDQTTGQQSFSAVLGVLAAGNHSLTIGGFNNKKTWGNEATELTIDDVTLVASPTEPPLPVDTTVSISALDAVQSEGDDGTTLFTFVVSRSGDIISPTTVDYTISGSGSNGAEGSDFLGGLLPSGSVRIDGEGVSATTITIAVAGDVDFEADETFIVTLSNPSPGSAIDTATASGTILNDDTAPVGPIVFVDADFAATGDTEGFTYSDGTFGGADPQAYADGSWRNEALAIDLGGVDNSDINDMSGAWEISFVLTTATDVSLSFSYELILSAFYENDEFGQVLYALDGNPAVVVDQVDGNGNGGADDTTGPQTFLADLGTLAAGTHTIALGGLNNQKTTTSESLELTIDDVLITGELPAAASASASSLLPPPPAESLPSAQENEILANAGV